MIPSVGLEIGVLSFTPYVFIHYTNKSFLERRERAPASTDELKSRENLIQELNESRSVVFLPEFQGFKVYTDNMQCISALDRLCPTLYC